MGGNLAASDRQTYMTEEENEAALVKGLLELELRAAKVLKCKVRGVFVDFPEKIYKALDISSYRNINDMKFTTSRDWAWLLVDEVLKRPELRQLFIQTVYMKTWLLDAELCLNLNEIWHLFELTPEQLALAAVEVLEAQSE